MKRLLPLTAYLLCTFIAYAQPGAVRINEILTQNYGSITNLYDEDGDSPDYIELYNTTNSGINLSGWKLVDDDNIWKFPAGTSIAANGYLTIWASGKDKSTSQLHTNFKLSDKGEYLGLYDSQNNLVFDFGDKYPQQYNKLSYGFDNSNQLKYFSTVSQNALNGNGFTDKVATPQATIGRGFYTTTVNEILTCATAGATIRYTTDGFPVTISSTVFNGSLTINPSSKGIVTIRAKAFLSSYIESEEVSFTYIFPNSIFSGNLLALEGLKSLPVVSINTNDQILPNCVFINDAYQCNEQNMLIEWIEQDSLGFILDGFSEIAGVKVFGEGSINQFKRGFRINFDPSINNKFLEYPLFEDYERKGSNPTDKFRKIEIRGGFFDSYDVDGFYENYPSGHYITENWWRSTVLDANILSQHSRFVFLFVNGEFRGIHTLREKYDHHFYESYSDVDNTDINSIRYSNRVGSNRNHLLAKLQWSLYGTIIKNKNLELLAQILNLIMHHFK